MQNYSSLLFTSFLLIFAQTIVKLPSLSAESSESEGSSSSSSAQDEGASAASTKSCEGVQGYCDSSRRQDEQGTPPDLWPCTLTLTPQSEEGPFFLPGQLIRQNITEGRQGVPLEILFTVKDVKSCRPVQDAQVHLWQADAMGVYSAYSGYYPLGDPDSKPLNHPHSEPTEVATFLRGIQPTDKYGKAKFQTIYPGWYKYRTVHTHFRVTVGGKAKYTGELYFPDELSDEINKLEPYIHHLPGRRLSNPQDWLFTNENGRQLLIVPKGDLEKGLRGSMEIVIDTTKKIKTAKHLKEG